MRVLARLRRALRRRQGSSAAHFHLGKRTRRRRPKGEATGRSHNAKALRNVARFRKWRSPLKVRRVRR